MKLQAQHVVAAKKTAIGDEAFQQAMLKEPPPRFPAAILLIASAVAFCCSTANGFDGSLLGTLLSNKKFKAFFDVGTAGIETGTLLIVALYLAWQTGN